MGTPRARWCAPARSPPWFYGRACKTLLKGASVARLTLWKPPAPITSRTRASPACAGRRTDLLRQRGRQADHHRTRVIKVGRPGSNGLRGGRLPSARRPSTRRPALAIVTCAAAPAGSPMSPMSEETVEEGGEIEAGLRIILRDADLEPRVCADPMLIGMAQNLSR